MIKRVTARAYANIALVKYWGKQPGTLNAPATPSISLTLEKLKTETVIEKVKSGDDRFFINGKAADHNSSKRLKAYLDFWRHNRLIDGRFVISSTNNFPTKSGLASSSSGYAALAKGLSVIACRKIGLDRLTKLARIGSGSAARSVCGGLAALPNTKNPAARVLLMANQIPWGMVIVEVESSEKEISSREGMQLCRKSSPYFKDWIKQAEQDYRAMLKAIKRMDFQSIGQITENNALAMHACMIATRPSLLFWHPATVEILHAVRSWRQKGLQAYATIDAGPHIVVLGQKADLANIQRRAKKIPGVKSVIKSNPAGEASIISWN